VVKAWTDPRRWHRIGSFGVALLLLSVGQLAAQTRPAQQLAPDANFGPYNTTFLAGGIGLSNPLASDAPLLKAGAAWSMSGWLQADRSSDAPMIVAALGDAAAIPADACCCRPASWRCGLVLRRCCARRPRWRLAPGTRSR